MNEINKEFITPFVNNKTLTSDSNIISNSNTILHKCLVIIGLVPISSVGTLSILGTLFSVTSKMKISVILFVLSCSALFATYLAFRQSISIALGLLAKLSAVQNKQISSLSKEEAVMHLQELHEHGISTSAYRYLRLLEKNFKTNVQSSVSSWKLNHFIAATVVMTVAAYSVITIVAAYLSLSYLLLEMHNATSVNIFCVAKFVLIFGCVLLDFLCMMWAKSTFNRIAENLYSIAIVEEP